MPTSAVAVQTVVQSIAVQLIKLKIYIMKNWILKNKMYGIGAVAGAIAGFLYWKYVGCLTGTCAITSNPVRSTIYFAILGALLFSLFNKDPKTKINSANR